MLLITFLCPLYQAVPKKNILFTLHQNFVGHNERKGLESKKKQRLGQTGRSNSRLEHLQ
jgi:hypothetical protein